MRRLTLGLLIVLSGIGLAVAGKADLRLADRWRAPGIELRPQRKLLVVAISEDVAARKAFENKFVSHLRGRGVEGVTGYSLVPDLTRPESRQQILERIADLGIDGAISVRLVSLADRSEDQWAEAWRAPLGTERRLRQLVEESLPVGELRSGTYGAEISLWTAESWSCVWSARTPPNRIQDLRKGAGYLVGEAMDTLKLDGLF